MKTLVQRINESNLYELKKFIINNCIGNTDEEKFSNALNLLATANSANGLIIGVDDYINKPKNPLKNSGYYLANIFDLSSLDVKSNINVLYDIVKNNKSDEINSFVDIVLSENKTSKNPDIKEQFIKSLNTFNKTNFLDKYCEGFKTLAENIFNIIKFNKPYTSTAKGGGELLIQLLFGTKYSQAADVQINDYCIEVKTHDGRLGNSNVKSSETTKIFINKLDENNIITETIKTDESCFGGKRKGGLNGVTVFNKFWENISINNTVENVETKIFKCYIETILRKYGIDNLADEIIKKLNDKNPFIIENNKLKIDETHVNFTDLTGVLYLIGYQFIEQFKYLIVFDKSFNYICFDCTDIIENYDIITKHIKFVLPGNKDDAKNIDNVAKVSLK